MSRYDGRLPLIYADAAAILRRRERCTVPGVGNTQLEQHDDRIDLTYHGNTIASYDRGSGDVFLTTAGYPTNGTHERLNAIARAVGVRFARQDGRGVIMGRGAWTLASSDEFGVTIRDLGWMLDWELTEREAHAA